MTPITRALAGAGLLALAFAPALADTSVRDASGTPRIIKGYQTTDGKDVPAAWTYATPVTVVNTGGTIATANTAQQAVGANTARRGGYLLNDPRSTGVIVASFGGTASATLGAANSCVLTPGQSCTLTVSGGVFQGAVSVASATAGTAYLVVESQQ